MSQRTLDPELTIEQLNIRVSELEAQVKSLLVDKDLLRPQWEYTSMWHINNTNLLDGTVQKMLNDLGKQGWEVVSCSVVHSGGSQPNTFYTLKRRKFA